MAFLGLGLVLALLLAAFAPARLWPDEPRRTGTFRIIGAIVLAVVATIPTVFYGYAISISAGLCGRDGWPEWLAGSVALIVVGSWGLRGRNRVWFAFPAAVAAATACSLLAAYLDGHAHGYCETVRPYSVTVRPLSSRYSAMFNSSSQPSRRSVT